MDSIVKTLGGDYQLSDSKIKDNVIVLFIESTEIELRCPYCGTRSSRQHSIQYRKIQDLPISEKKTILIVATRKMRCLNPECSHKFFSEQHPFAEKSAQKTNRLINRILKTSAELSSVSSSRLLNSENIKVGKSSICDLLKKNTGDCG